MKDKKILYGIILFIIFLLSIGVTYAYFNVTTSVIGDRNDIKASVGTLNILYTDGPEIVGNNIQPGWTTTKTITIENNGTLDTNYSIEWSELTNGITNDELVMSATCEQTLDGSVNGTCLNINETPVATSTGSIVHNINIPVGYKHTYVITFEFIEISSAQNYNQDKAFNGVINILGETYTIAGILYDSNGDPIEGATIEMHSNPKYATTDSEGNFEIVGLETGEHTITITSSTDVTLAVDEITLIGGSGLEIEGNKITVNNSTYTAKLGITLNESAINTMVPIITLTDKILMDNTAYADNVSSPYVTSGTGINFAAISSNTNGKGLYYTTNAAKTEAGKTVYYFRGAVTNNYVIFGGFCWRIVRTVEDGSVRLRYSGTPTSGSCPQTGTLVNIGNSYYNSYANDNTYIGYMYGGISNIVVDSTSRYQDLSGQALNYGSSYTYTAASNTFALSGTIINGTWGTSTICISSGTCPALNYYTCGNGAASCDTLFKIQSRADSYAANINYVTKASESYSAAHSNNVNSTIKTKVDTWYNSNLSSFSSKIADTPYCNDRSLTSGNGYGIITSTYTTWGRTMTTPSPTYVCTQNNDKFTVSSANGNGALTYPVGMLTIDETMFAGGKTFSSNNTYYLYTGGSYRVMTPTRLYGSGIGIFTVESTGSLSSSTTAYNYGTIPVISLKNSVSVASGTGVYNNPYIIN